MFFSPNGEGGSKHNRYFSFLDKLLHEIRKFDVWPASFPKQKYVFLSEPRDHPRREKRPRKLHVKIQR